MSDPKAESSDEFDSSSDDSQENDGGAKPAANDDDDDEFAFGNGGGKDAGKDKPPAKIYKDQHFDEALAVSEDEESVDDSSMSFDQAAQKPPAAAGGKEEFSDDDDDSSGDDSSDEGDDSTDAKPGGMGAPGGGGGGGGGMGGGAQKKSDDDDDDDEEGDSSSESSSSEEDDDDDEPSTNGEGSASAYNPADYANLSVSNEIQDLFDYISRHKPSDIDLETKLKPFIPDFIPAVGEIDSFLKVPRPDGKSDGLGLTVLDEPAVNQSDPTVLDIKIRVMSKHSGVKAMTVRSIENADKHPKKISSWISNIEEVHRKKPPPSVNYSKNMPDIETLMQVWPSELEELFKEVPLPQAELDMDLKQYTRVVCSILDIPVYDKLTEALHVLFTLYTEFKSNSHFQAIN